jgi:hypothetical protein
MFGNELYLELIQMTYADIHIPITGYQDCVENSLK